ncbi:MAG: hypothetical protein ACLQQ4_01400 [Bacteroidia bacterium]
MIHTQDLCNGTRMTRIKRIITDLITRNHLHSIVLIACSVMALTNTSCTDGNKFKKKATTLDSLASLLHKADSTLSTIDTATIKKDDDHVMISLQLIKLAHRDSMSAGAASIFRNFSSIRWQLETFLGRRRVMMIEMGKSMNQLAHLSHDLKFNLIKADSVPVYYNTEVKKATLLLESEKTSMESLNNQLPLYNLILPQADSLTSLIKKHKEI